MPSLGRHHEAMFSDNAIILELPRRLCHVVHFAPLSCSIRPKECLSAVLPPVYEGRFPLRQTSSTDFNHIPTPDPEDRLTGLCPKPWKRPCCKTLCAQHCFATQNNRIMPLFLLPPPMPTTQCSQRAPSVRVRRQEVLGADLPSDPTLAARGAHRHGDVGRRRGADDRSRDG